MGGESRSHTIPPVDRGAEAVKEQDGRSLSVYRNVCRLNPGIDNLAAIARRCRSCARINPDRICCEQRGGSHNQADQPDPPASPPVASYSLIVAHVRSVPCEDLLPLEKSFVGSRIPPLKSGSALGTATSHRMIPRSLCSMNWRISVISSVWGNSFCIASIAWRVLYFDR